MLSLTVEKKSWMHKIPVPLKLGLLCVLTVLMFPINDWHVALLATVCVATIYLSAGVEFARIGLQRLKPLSYLLAIIFIYHVVTLRTVEGLTICLKLFATVGLANMVTMTSRLDDMMAVVETLAKPFRRFGVTPRVIGFALGLVVRFTPIFIQKGQLLNEAWRARSAKKLSPRLIVPMALGALDDADRVADALRARGGLIEATPVSSPRDKN